MIDTHTLRESDAQAAEQDAGYIVARLGGAVEQLDHKPTREAACTRAAELAAASPGDRIGVFKLIRDYRSEVAT